MMTLEDQLDYQFRDSSLSQQALTHKSYHNENILTSGGHNEVLEFLGDAVLGVVLAESLILQFPELTEGDLSKLRASLVNEVVLAELGQHLSLAERLKLGKGEIQTGGQAKPRLIASALEALIGAIYLDGGFEPAKEFILKLFAQRCQALDPSNSYSADYKTRLQEISQEKFRQTPMYEVIKEEGPDHNKTFYVCVKLNGKALAEGHGRSKKLAEQEAAKLALEGLV